MLILPALLLAGSAFAQDRSVNFEHGTFNETLTKAKEAKKLVFMDGYTSWCGPCKFMATKVFTQNKVADFFNENFINAKFDMEKGEGVDLAKKYEVKAFPTFLILDTEGNVVHRIVGGGEADEFIERVKKGMDPATSLSGMQKKYNSGDYDSEFVKGYLKTLQDAYMEKESQDVAVKYLASLKEKERTTKETWPIYNDFITDASSKEFMFILTNRIKFTDAVGDSAVNAKINNVFTEKAMTLLMNSKRAPYTKKDADSFRNVIAASKVEGANKFNFILDLADAKFNKKATAAAKLVSTDMKKIELSDQEYYGIISSIVPLMTDNGKKDEIALVTKSIDERIATMKDDKVKPYFEKLKGKFAPKEEKK